MRPSRRRRPKATLLVIVLGAACAVASTAAAQESSILHPVSPTAESIRELFYLILGITGVIFVLVEGVLLYSILRFRARGRDDDNVEPPQLYGSQPIELAWTVAPLLTVIVLLLITVRTIGQQRRDPTVGEPVKVIVVGHQWWWEYIYPELGVTTANELHVPVSTDGSPRPIDLQLESVDVIHSFWVPRLAGKTDVIPGRTNHMWFEPRETGLFIGHCAEYCGTQHANMKIRVYVDEPQEFDRWINEQRQPAVDDPAAREGHDLFMSLACVNCHTIRGTPAKGIFGPDLTHLMSRETIASGTVANNHENLIAWVDNPDTIKPGCRMPSMHLEPDQVATIVAYLETLH